jgi:acetylornithine deacetylase/succinyl-diaminopimelate desuccinylase-like protein
MLDFAAALTRRLLAAAVLASAPTVWADALAVQARLRADVEFLADDRLEGRDVGTPGSAEAASYIRDRFRELGLASGTPDGTYFQVFSVRIGTEVREASRLELTAPDGSVVSLERGKDFQPLVVGGDGAFHGPIVFAGYGITSDEPKYDDFEGLDVEGKIVVLLRREPQQGDPKSPFNGTEITRHAELKTKIANAWTRKAAAVLLVNDEYSVVKEGKDQLVSPSYFPDSGAVGVPVCHVTRDVADRLLADSPAGSLHDAEERIDATLEPQSTPLEGWSARGVVEFGKIEVETPNVVGILEGQGPCAQETIVVGAHYDHIGLGGVNSRRPGVVAVHNGADDNASGVATLLELAKRFSQRPEKPSRRLVFIAFSGEERGLLGSKHYVRKDPLVPLEDTILMINFDMVGRLRDQRLIVYGVRTADGVEELVKELDDLDEQLAVRSVPLGVPASDHISFYQAKIPALHFFTGTHPDYHMPTDVADKLNYEGIQQVSDFAERLLDKFLDRPERLAYREVKESDPHAGLQIPSGGDAPYLGTSPDYGDEVEGVLLNGVREGSPADLGGLKAGDVIVEFAGQEIKNVRQYTTILYSHKPDDKVRVVVLRGEGDAKERVELEVVLGRRSPASER